MAYTLEEFCEHTRAALGADDGDGAREAVRTNLGRLLDNGAFVAAHCGPDAERGIHRLYEDPELGFVVLAHIYENGVESPPHDHGPSWAIYGQAVEHTEMTVWRETGKAPAETSRSSSRLSATGSTPGWSGSSTRATSTRSSSPTARASSG